MNKKIILFTLQTFSTTGGIQKMTRTLAHSLFHISKQKDWSFKLWSVYDSRYDLMGQYLPPENFKAFGRNKINLGLKTVGIAQGTDFVILSHVNLSLLGLIIKLI